MPSDAAKALHPKDAMYQLLKHIKMDPDGGILNIVEDTEQANKLRALRKDGLESCLAIVGALRAVANPTAMMYFALRLLYGYKFDAAFKDRLQRHCLEITVSIPLEQLYVICATMETLVALFCVMCAVYHGILALTYDCKHAADTDSDNTKLGAILKYMHVAEFYLRDIPRLQNLSSLRLLAYAHPNLISKNAKQFTSKSEIARRMLEKLFGKEADSCSDEQLSEEVASLIVQHVHKDADEQKKINIANDLVDLTPYEALMELNNCEKEQMRAFLLSKSLQPDILNNLGRLRLVIFLETLAFGIIVYSCAFFGMVEFFTKVCRLSFLLTNPDVPWWISAFFFMFLLNQSMGMNSIQELLRWRVETFIFGGSDAIVSAEEKYTMNVYLALLMDKVWNSKALPFRQKLAIMLQLDDDDLQQLVVEERETHKGLIVASVRKWIRDSGAKRTVSDRIASLVIR